MYQYWLFIVLSWIDFASLQYINTGGPGANSVLDPPDPALQYPLPYSNYFNLALPSEADFQKFQSQQSNTDQQTSTDRNNQFYHREDGDQEQNIDRKSSDADVKDTENWYPNIVDIDKTSYIRDDDLVGAPSPFLSEKYNEYQMLRDPNTTNLDILDRIHKRSFSPWGGKRSKPRYEQNNLWTWKRTANIREPSMPKRVRFSPWGGKRSGQVIYKPGLKGSKIIFSNSIPDLTRIISNYSPNEARFKLAGLRLIPSIDKQHPIRILALTTQLEDMSKESVPIHAYVESAKLYKPGHPFVNMSLKKDGKRKVKFSAWGGKRSPPIIGPIWTPPPSDNGKDNTLDAIILIRDSLAENGKTTKAL